MHSVKLDSIITQAAKECLDLELGALQTLKSCIDDTFVGVVRALFEMKGRLVITGIGKSAIVAQKIVATLNSTGTPSLFMHAADAIHGDLGMIQQGDVVLCISKSGETPEIRVLIPLIRMRKVRLIGISSNASSTLATQSDDHLYIPLEREAEPNNLAPTASTTAQMALGDAIAVSLLKLRGFSSSDFAEFHPGGSLGKQLYLRVADFSERHEKPFVLTGDSLQKVLLSMSSGRLGATAVLDESGGLCGVITDGDIRRLFGKSLDFSGVIASDIMNGHPRTIRKEEMAVFALRQMQEFSISQLVVMDEEKYSGMIHMHDLIREGFL